MKHYYIGLMTGTSVDSLDAALVEFDNEHFHLLNTYSLPLPDTIQNSVKQLITSGNGEIDLLRQLDHDIAILSCETIEKLCEKSSIAPTLITAIGSHGQTVRHYPKTAHCHGYSLQVGDPNIIAEKTGITTVADFRRRDIAAGGHGAPLVPAFHRSVFQSNQRDRIILNMGGIANITYLPKQGDIIGFDTGPANTLMDSWCQQHQHQSFDKDGNWASTGAVNNDLLNLLLSHPYFSTPHPKSTGRETFNLLWLEEQLCQLKEQHNLTLPPAGIQASLLALTTETICHEITKLDPQKQADIYTCGGGSHNSALMKKLSNKLHPRAVSTTDSLGIHPDWVEAAAFAWLAKRTMDKASGNLPSVTGAEKEVILGGIYQAN